MQVCPICGNSGAELRVCGNCGFDLSEDAVSFPTLRPITPMMRKLRTEARQRWELSQGSYAMPKKELTDNLIHVVTEVQKKKTAQEGTYAVSGEKLVDHQVKTGAASPKEDLKKDEYSAAGDKLVDKTLKQDGKQTAANSTQGGQQASEAPAAPAKQKGSCLGSLFGLLFWLVVIGIIGYLFSVGGIEAVIGPGVLIFVLVLIFRRKKNKKR